MNCRHRFRVHVKCGQESVQVGDHGWAPKGPDVCEHADSGHSSLTVHGPRGVSPTDLDEMLAGISEIEESWVRALEGLRSFPEAAGTLAEVFDGSGCSVDPTYEDVRVVRITDLFQHAPLYVQPTIGVPRAGTGGGDGGGGCGRPAGAEQPG